MKSLDTNILLRFLLNDHSTQSPAVADMIHKSSPRSYAVADVALFEAAWVMQGEFYQLPRATIAKLLLYLTLIEQINCNRPLLQQALPLYEAHSSLSLVDVALCMYAKLNLATPLLTYDKKLARKLPELAELVTNKV